MLQHPAAGAKLTLKMDAKKCLEQAYPSHIVVLVERSTTRCCAALTDLLGGQVLISFAGIAGSIEYVRSGKLRALAVTTTTRSEALSDVATVSEFLPGFEAGNWLGVGAPRDTPTGIIDGLNKEITAGRRRSQNQGALCRSGRHPAGAHTG